MLTAETGMRRAGDQAHAVPEHEETRCNRGLLRGD